MTEIQRHREAIGLPIEDLDTPALLLDWQKCQGNLSRMAAFFADRPAKIRPHFKNHKCITLAKKQVEAGSTVGMTCAKLSEAEVLAAHGFDDVLIANQVVGAGKLKRLANLAKKINLRFAADDPQQVIDASAAATAAGVTLDMLVEVDNGMGRCGLAPGQPSLELAQQIDQAPGLTFAGVQSYEGHTVYITDEAERTVKTREAMQLAIDTRKMIEQAGIAAPVVTGGATGTYHITGVMDGMDEIQAGTYATMDWRYHEVMPHFDIALSVLVRIISKRQGAAVIDLGVKGAGSEFGEPRIKDHDEIVVPFFLAEEHLVLKNAPHGWKVGQPLELISSHACTTCNLHRVMFVHEGGKVVDVWPIEASGLLT